MSESRAEEQAWAGEKREFVADSRDDAADERDIAADARDALADAREAQLNKDHEQLQRHASAAMSPEGVASDGPTERDARAAREVAREERSDISRDREEEKVSRDEATERREHDARPTPLALTFAGIAETLYDADTYEEVLTRIAAAAVATVAGGRSASVTLLEDGDYRNAGPTDQSATAVDQAQYDAEEGPTMDAFTTPIVDAPSFPDERWPQLGAQPADHGVQSSLSYQLDTSSREPAEPDTASLNIYGITPDAFDQVAQEIGTILAAHASLAARAVSERATLQALGQHLEQALLSRDVIGQAKGILMERLKATPEEAFDILKRSSQQLNLKLREVARDLAETGEVNTASSNH